MTKEFFKTENVECLKTRSGDWFARAYPSNGEAYEQFGITRNIALNNLIRKIKENTQDTWLIEECNTLID